VINHQKSFSPNSSRSRERLQPSGKSNSCDISDNSLVNNLSANNLRQLHNGLHQPSNPAKTTHQNHLNLNAYQNQLTIQNHVQKTNIIHNSRSKNLKSNTIWYNGDEQNRSNSADVNTLSKLYLKVSSKQSNMS